MSLLLREPGTTFQSERRSAPKGSIRYGEFIALAAVVLLVAGFVQLVRHGLASHGIPFTYGFLGVGAGFDLSQGTTIVGTAHGIGFAPYAASDTNLQALVAGAINTLIVALISIVFTTGLGLFVGVARLSSNWIVRQWASLFVECIRNTPLLVQLVFWYFAVLLKLPALHAALRLPGGVLASQRGIYLPVPHLTGTSLPYLGICVLAAALILVGYFLRRSTRMGGLAYAAAMILLLAGWVALGAPLRLPTPRVMGFRVVGGIEVSPEMAALLIALIVNTAAYIAEIVRGAIQSVPRGQWEAAASLGLSRGDTMRIIIMPQAVRVLIPSLGNQYVSLSKNSSLGIAIGFPDLFNVYGTVANQTGRYLEGIIIVMAFYLAIGLGISAVTNAYNRRIVRRGAR